MIFFLEIKCSYFINTNNVGCVIQEYPTKPTQIFRLISLLHTFYGSTKDDNIKYYSVYTVINTFGKIYIPWTSHIMSQYQHSAMANR